MRAYQYAFPYTEQWNPYDVIGPLTARLGTAYSPLPQLVTGNSTVVPEEPAAAETKMVSNPITDSVKGWIVDQGKGLLFIAIGLILLTVAIIRLTKG